MLLYFACTKSNFKIKIKPITFAMGVWIYMKYKNSTVKLVAQNTILDEN